MTQATVNQAMEIIKMQDYGAPVEHIADYVRQNNISTVVAYHVTTTKNLETIRMTGLTAKGCYNREAAVYFFLDYADAKSNAINLVGDDTEYDILVINIPAESAASMKWDGLYNVGFGTSYSAARIERNIPITWITGKVKK